MMRLFLIILAVALIVFGMVVVIMPTPAPNYAETAVDGPSNARYLGGLEQ